MFTRSSLKSIFGLSFLLTLSLSTAWAGTPAVQWNLDDGVGTTAMDSSGNGNTGTLNNNPTWIAGAFGTALRFNGTTQSLTRGNITGLPTGNTPHTMAAWIRVNALPPNRAWIALLGNFGNGSHHWLINNAGVTQFGIFNGSQTAPTLTVGTWTHVAITSDATTLTCYVNGQLFSSVAIGAQTFNLQGLPITVAQAQAGENFFNGDIDEFQIYAQALTAAEVAALAAPRANSFSVSTKENVAVGTLLSGKDGQNLPLNFTVATQPANGVLSGNAPNLTYTPNLNFFGIDTFTYTVDNGTLTSVPATVTINVSHIPVAVDDTATTNEGVPVAIDVLANDTVVDVPPTVIVSLAPVNGTTSVTNNIVTYSPTPGFFGTDTFQYTVTDFDGDTATATVTITVNIIPPQITSPLIANAVVGFPFSYTITAIGTNPISLGASGLPAGLTFANGVISGSLTAVGSYAVTLTAQGPLSTDTKTLVINVGLLQPNVDTDSDGFPDELEIFLSTNPVSATSSPFNGKNMNADPFHLSNPVANVLLNFAKPKSDKVTLRGSLPVPNDFRSNGQNVVVDFGGVMAKGRLSKTGKFISLDRKVMIALSSPHTTKFQRNAKFSFKYEGIAASQLADEGLTNENVSGYRSVRVIVLLLQSQIAFDDVLTLFYDAEKGVKGKAKGVPNTQLPAK